MTNHIEQLMKTAGVKPVIRYYLYFINEEMEITKEALIQCAKAFTNLGKITRVTRECPVFTPEKQLELIKLVSNFNCFQDELNNWVMTHYNINLVRSYRVEANKDFSDSLANFILYLIFTDQLDKSEVRRILEDD